MSSSTRFLCSVVHKVELNLIIELLSVGFNLVFIILLIKENIWCWPFGIVGSLLSVYLFILVQLNAESLLYVFYVIMGAYGWWNWSKPIGEELLISKWNITPHLTLVIGGVILGLALGWIFDNYTEAVYPFVDSQTTVFGIAATFLEARKKLYAWIYWIVLNGVSIILYASRDLFIYSGLMVVFFALSVYGFRSWSVKFSKQ